MADRVCVFCGSRRGEDPAFVRVAEELGRALAARGTTVVYGGGHIGLMGVVAEAALAAGGEVIGVIPDALVAKELAHGGLSQLRVTASMHERKAVMADLADAFVAMPGGLGTFEELCEILTWAQLGLHAKPVVVLDVADYFGPLFALFDAGVAQGFLRPDHRELALRATTVAEALDLLDHPVAAPAHKWIDLDET
jgi:uncharacterized protein (TIGR00730 family)